MSQTVLLTGGAGYIGSHTALELLNAGHDVVIVDNLCNSKLESIRRVQQLAGHALRFFKADLRDADAMRTVFHNVAINAVIHFAGLKAVGESVKKPGLYYDNNVVGTLTLLEAMDDANVRNIVFSSSATVYGDPQTLPIREDFPLCATNPYGNTKLFIEKILHDYFHADHRWNMAILRYFNPVGAHESGQIGEDPDGIPNNLMPYIAQVASGRLPMLRVFGNDYPTQDGTGVRDYIHVVDLAQGHIKALDQLREESGLFTLNLGTGKGYSVLDMLSAFEKACGKSLPYEVVGRRSGDVAACYADPERAFLRMGWRAERDQDTMCRDAWRWQSQNPHGYADHGYAEL
jgi:UDP-glucose 4-epimerase